jgi:hypothetical protein
VALLEISADLRLTMGELAGFVGSVFELLLAGVVVTFGADGRLTRGLKVGAAVYGRREMEGSGNDVSSAGMVIFCSGSGWGTNAAAAFSCSLLFGN